MDTKTALTHATVAGLLLTSVNTMAAPDAIVIDQNSSQVTETLGKQDTLSFTPMRGTLLPVGQSYSPFQLPNFDSSERRNWTDHIGQPVRVEHKQRDFSLEGTLDAVSGNSFTLSVKRVAASYPLSDFYLVPKLAAANSRSSVNYQGTLTYQTGDLTWQPELSMIINDRDVTLIQQASIDNQASSDLELDKVLLHYSQNRNVRPMMKNAMASDMRVEGAAPSTDYSNNEITLELQQLALPAASETLVDLGKTTSRIEQSRNVTSVYSYASASKLPLSFHQEIRFSSPKDLIPGNYQTLWYKEPYYVQGNRVSLQHTRENAEITVQLNRSLDIKGDLTLVTESKQGDHITQTWELNLENLSRQNQAYQINHQLQGTITDVSLRSLEQTAANQVSLSGTLAANSDYQIRYTVDLEK
ncbi:hypothetical protein [Marinomonas ostreistagni]|uniref:hypothetical protein n=1 Tax=Marinomonas ostreistagni TaxID=359209 RepID=UPI00194F3E88|nr:hypothetical protein [Marinomonas ostreistagni]MBM6550501.1 hypothetical protein [Marinomonas ostreistagni]